MLQEYGTNEYLNYDDNYFRNLCLSFGNIFKDNIKMTYRYSDGTVEETPVPIHYGLSGNNDFLMNAFYDEWTKKIELNTDVIPRMIYTMGTPNIKMSEYANPNVMIRFARDYKSYYTTVKPIPLKVPFEMTVLMENEYQMFQFYENLFNVVFKYKFFHFDYKFTRIDSVMTMPDDSSNEKLREFGLQNPDSHFKFNLSFEVDTYYPSFDPSNKVHAAKRIREFINNTDNYDLTDDNTEGFFVNDIFETGVQITNSEEVKPFDNTEEQENIN